MSMTMSKTQGAGQFGARLHKTPIADRPVETSKQIARLPAHIISAAALLAVPERLSRPTSAQLPNNFGEMSVLCAPMLADSEPVAWAPWQPDEHLNVSQTSPHEAWVASHASSEAGTSQSELWGVDPDTARLGDESWFDTNESSGYSTEPLAMPLAQEEPQRAPFTLSFEPSSVPGRLPLHPTCRETDDAESTEREDSEDSDVDAGIRCPNCGEVKGSKGTWCRSPSCAKRRETLAKAQIRKVDSKTVFQYDEPAYRTPPVPEPEVVVEKPRTVSGAPARPAASQAPREAPLKKPRPASETTAPASAKQSSPRELFMAEVTELQEKNGTPFAKVPTVGMKALDLYTLYEEVSSRGGLHGASSPCAKCGHEKAHLRRARQRW